MRDKIFIGKKETQENPINNRDYQALLGLNPTLANEIKRNVSEVLFEDVRSIHKDELFDNNSIISNEAISRAKQELISELEALSEATDESKHIVVVVDDCFTNKKLLILLRNILGKENFRRFVRVVDIDYKKSADNEYLEEMLGVNHSLFVLGGSLSDTYDMDDSHYNSYLSNLVREVGDEYSPRYLNKRLVGVCFGQQYLANILGMANRNSAGIIATLKGPTQLAPSNCHIEELRYTKSIFSEILSGLSNNGTNTEFSSIFTRSGYVSFDLLKTAGSNLGVVPLIRDDATSGVVGWGSKNGNILGVQFHPEVSFLTQKINTGKHLKNVVQSITPEKEEQERYLNNFHIDDRVERDIGEAFYVFSMLAYIKDIHHTFKQIDSSLLEEDSIMKEVPYNNATGRLVKMITERVDYGMNSDTHLGDEVAAIDWINAIDKKGRLLLNYQLDWKVNRSIEEVSEILGIRSLVEFIREHRSRQHNGNYVVRDLGAGDGSTIKGLYNSLKYQDIIFYGTGDYIYFDLFSALNSTKLKEEIPEELLILFVEKVVVQFKALGENGSTIEKIKKSIELITFSEDDTIQNSSMTNKKTLMFESEHESYLSPEIRKNFAQHQEDLARLKVYVTENLYALFSNFFKRIYISKFNDLMIRDEIISRVDFQYSIRATSHVNGREYMKIISEYFYDAAKTGSIFIDNGIHQSYTSIPRLKELYDVSLDIVGGSMKLIYNTEKNYFSSVVISKGIDYDGELLEKHLDPNHIIVPLKEAHKSTFFRLEYFIRNFIVANFKNNIVFWNFNDQILDTLKMIMRELEQGNTTTIPSIILELINHIARNYTNKGTKYNEIDMAILDTYTIDDESLHDILDKDIFIPSWMNIYADRDY